MLRFFSTMASLVATAALTAAARTLSIGEALSGIFGSISLTAWICLLVRRALLAETWISSSSRLNGPCRR